MIAAPMSAVAPSRSLVTLILAIWMFSGVAAALHGHCACCECHHDQADDAPCEICIAIAFAPAIVVAKGESVEVERDVIAWITPWIAVVPNDVFFDRPLARGPPVSS